MAFGDTLWHRWLKRPYRLHAVQAGQAGGEPVLLLHGVGASAGVWQSFIRQAQHAGNQAPWRIMALDLLGFGESPKPQWSTYTVEEHARAVVATLRSLKVRRPVTIIGHSMGCLVATHIAATRPHLVSQLVLYEPPLYADDPEFQRHVRRRGHYFALYEFIASHKQLAFTQAQLLWRVAKRLVNFNLSEAMWTPFERSIRNTIMRQTAYQELHTIRIPTAIIHGRLDLVVARTDLRKMFRANTFITWYAVTDFHGISTRSARFLVQLLAGQLSERRQRPRGRM